MPRRLVYINSTPPLQRISVIRKRVLQKAGDPNDFNDNGFTLRLVLCELEDNKLEPTRMALQSLWPY